MAAGETIEVDVSAGFTGAVDTYSATSGDAVVATVSASGSVVSISGVSVVRVRDGDCHQRRRVGVAVVRGDSHRAATPTHHGTNQLAASTLNTTRSFSSGLFFEAFAMLISLRQTQTAD